ncbi:uncharacterized protein LOC124272612 isoform X3 [Haliotis rubra]|uniref:uncharacterized protein LOC124272612 isoform X3 n=1 Tax=Haliotis rubra TaxID=36100 RepID=UPI001EE59AA4|nr:uncharacterized protein LOC124272612 isoform X3 [Haliotis rubra]
MSDAKVHIVTCSNFECETEYARMCVDLETRGVVCVMEGRGDYGIGSTFVEKFKEMVESTLVTIIHLCPDMIGRLTNLTDVLQGHQRQKYLFIHVKSTPKEIPVVYKEVTKMLLVNDSYYKKIIDKILEIVQQPICASSATELTYASATELSSATKEDDDLYSDTGISPYFNPPLTERDVFVSHVEDQQCRDTGVYFLSSKIQCKPHHLLKWSSQGELREMCHKSRLYDSSNRSNTVRCLLTKVLPDIFARKKIPEIAELLAVPISVVQNKVLTKLRDILLSTKPEDIDHSDLRTAEKALFECCLTKTDFIDPVFVPNFICTYLLTLVYLTVFQDSRHSSLDTVIKRVKQFISQQSLGSNIPFGDISSFVDDIRKRIDDVDKAVKAIGTNRKHLSTVKKKSWPVHFSMVLGTLIEVFHGEPQTALAALDTLPLLLKPRQPRVRNVLQKPKLNERVIQMVTSGMVAYLNALGDTVGEDIEDRVKSAFTALGLSLKYLDGSMFGMVRCLLFSQNPVIRQGAMILWKDASDETTESLMVTEVLKHLQPISTNHLHKQPTNHSTSSASWKVASTRIGSDKIMLHINLPSDLPEKISSVTPDILFPGLDRTSYQDLPNEDSERDDGYDDAVHDYQNFKESQTSSSVEEPLYEELGPKEDVGSLLKPNQRMDVLRRRLTQTEESQLNTENIPGIYGCVTVEESNQTEYLVYDFPTGHCVSLSNVVDVRSFGLWSVKYIRCLSAVARTLSLLHQRNWVHGCLSTDNIWICDTKDDGDYKVYFSDLGYIRRSCNIEDGVIADESFVVPQDEHVYRRSSPEVIRDGTYSWASDVFSFGLILWSGFSNFSSYHNQKDLNKLESIPKDKLYEYLTTTSGNQILPKPAKCLDSIYSLMLLCWSPERHERPRMTIVQQKLLESISDEVSPCQDRDQYDSVVTEGQSSEDDLYADPDPDPYYTETKVSSGHNTVAECSEINRLPSSFSPATQAGGSTTALHQEKLKRQSPKTSQAPETIASGDYDEVENSSLQHDGSRSSYISSTMEDSNVLVNRETALRQENAKTQNTSQVSFYQANPSTQTITRQ